MPSASPCANASTVSPLVRAAALAKTIMVLRNIVGTPTSLHHGRELTDARSLLRDQCVLADGCVAAHVSARAAPRTRRHALPNDVSSERDGYICKDERHNHGAAFRLRRPTQLSRHGFVSRALFGSRVRATEVISVNRPSLRNGFNGLLRALVSAKFARMCERTALASRPSL